MDNSRISGKYRHYKGDKNANQYDVFCEVYDNHGNHYVLYRQDYGTKDYWIRPYDMFFETVKCEYKEGLTKTVPRFKASGKLKDSSEYIEILINELKGNNLIVKHSETEERYFISSISTEDRLVCVHPCSEIAEEGGFLSEYEIIRRMGKRGCLIDSTLQIWDDTDQPLP